MRRVAQLSFPGGQALLPIRTPYDHEQLFDHLAHRVRRDGSVSLEFDSHVWLVTVSTIEEGHVCGCGIRLQGLTFRANGDPLCVRCVRAMLNGRSRFTTLMGFEPKSPQGRKTA
jgi:hypothetical protein